MRAGFLALSREYADRFCVISGTGTLEEVAARVTSTVQDHLS
jgi:dTMP kinase